MIKKRVKIDKLLTPLKKEPNIIEDDGLLIISGQLGIDNLDEFIKKQREEKIVKVLKDIGKAY